ncbi:MAG: phosphonate metabolism protein/1,5-bisphosphokinase (PRPP-forming) PhnN [Pseudomonadota bacterium]
MKDASPLSGRLIAVVGPSGVGKDSVMIGLRDALPHLHLVKRVITRAPGLGGEDYEAVSEAEFLDLMKRDAFAVHWQAHGLRYGIPQSVQGQLDAGTDCLANVSRGALERAHAAFANLVVLNITATPKTLAARLTARGRETHSEIERRLAQAQKPLPDGLTVIEVSNDGPLTETVTRAAELLQAPSA